MNWLPSSLKTIVCFTMEEFFLVILILKTWIKVSFSLSQTKNICQSAKVVVAAIKGPAHMEHCLMHSETSSEEYRVVSIVKFCCIQTLLWDQSDLTARSASLIFAISRIKKNSMSLPSWSSFETRPFHHSIWNMILPI